MGKLLQFAILLPFLASAQFGIVNDKDGFANVRKAGSTASPVVAKLPNGTIVYCFETTGDWTTVDLYSPENDISGVIHKDRIVLVSGFAKIPYSYSSGHKTILERDSIKIVLTEKPFEKGNAVFSYYKDNPEILQYINGKEIFGKDGGVPQTQYGLIDIMIGKDRISIPQIGLLNLFEPSLENSQAYYDPKNDTVYIYASNSDGAGAYDVLWIVEKRQYKSRHEFKGF